MAPLLPDLLYIVEEEFKPDSFGVATPTPGVAAIRLRQFIRDVQRAWHPRPAPEGGLD
jgi:hypothetical protein